MTNIESFKEASLYWLTETLNNGKSEFGYAGFEFLNIGSVKSPIGFLNGLSGVGLSLLAMIQNEEPKWDEIVMLS